MKKTILIISMTALLISCDKKFEEQQNCQNKSVKGKIKINDKTKTKNSLKKSNDLIKNVKSFRKSIDVSNQILPTKFDTLTVAQVDNVLTSSISLIDKVVFANKVSMSCRDFDAGNYCFSNLYQICIANKKTGLYKPVLVNWANFAMSHRKLEYAIAILNKLKKIPNVTPRSEVDRLYYSAYTYWLAKDMKKYRDYAEQMFNITINHEDDIPESIVRGNVDFYFAALNNCKEYDYAMNKYYEYKKDNNHIIDYISDYTLENLKNENNKIVNYSWPVLQKNKQKQP